MQECESITKLLSNEAVILYLFVGVCVDIAGVSSRRGSVDEKSGRISANSPD